MSATAFDGWEAMTRFSRSWIDQTQNDTSAVLCFLCPDEICLPGCPDRREFPLGSAHAEADLTWALGPILRSMDNT
jgi:hypothetical protein